MFRFFDALISILGLTLGSPIFIFLTIAGFLVSGSPIYRQERVGKNLQPFMLYKFRTMLKSTASRPSHLISPDNVTPYGRLLRLTKLDELPQLWNVLRGDMSLVGPRPCLFVQQELIKHREVRGVLTARPGITGLAQLSDIDMSTPDVLAQVDAQMLESLNLSLYFKYILLTLLGRGSGDRVKR